MAGPDAVELLAAYDAQLRAHEPERPAPGVQSEWDGPLLRTTGFGDQGWIEYHDLGGIEGGELGELIARQVRFFAERGEAFEWKYHGHDVPADLPDRLRAAGFEPQELETVVIAPVAALDVDSPPPDGVIVREVTESADFDRIAGLEEAVWGGNEGAFVKFLEQEYASDRESLRFVVAEADGTVVSAGWVRFPSGTAFATLWGGATLPEWRGRGIYRSLVARRAQLAAERGCCYLETDASDDSRPILERLGFVAVTTTTPYVWSPG
ncbi:MAG: GNAT family N-acetyltransferase [Gaiellaceae bacterium]